MCRDFPCVFGLKKPKLLQISSFFVTWVVGFMLFNVDFPPSPSKHGYSKLGGGGHFFAWSAQGGLISGESKTPLGGGVKPAGKKMMAVKNTKLTIRTQRLFFFGSVRMNKLGLHFISEDWIGVLLVEATPTSLGGGQCPFGLNNPLHATCI